MTRMVWIPHPTRPRAPLPVQHRSIKAVFSRRQPRRWNRETSERRRLLCCKTCEPFTSSWGRPESRHLEGAWKTHQL